MLNWNDTASWPPAYPTHGAHWVATYSYQFKASPSPLARLSPTGKWCEHCAKNTHNDAECWSTRAAP